MNSETIQLRDDVLRRVRAVFYLRTVGRPLVIKVAFLAGLSIVACSIVSVPSIIFNVSHSQMNTAAYFADAFSHTNLMVKTNIVLVGVLFLFVARDVFKNLKYLKHGIIMKVNRFRV